MKLLQRLMLISRPAGYIPFTAAYLAGALANGYRLTPMTLLGAVFMTFPMGIVVFGLNDIADRESDEKNERKGGPHGAVVRRYETKAIIAAALVSYFSFVALLVALHLYAAICGWLGIGLFAVTYSVKPIRLKARPILDSLSNGLWGLSIVLTGYWQNIYGFHIIWPAIHVILAVIVGCAALHILGSLPDYEVDKAANDKTIAVFLGKPLTYFICLAIFAAFAILMHSHIAYVLYGILGMGLSLLGIFRNQPSTAKYIFIVLVVSFPLAFAARVLFGAWGG